jgi:hypothetical protein
MGRLQATGTRRVPRARAGHRAIWWLSRWPVVLHRWGLGGLLRRQYVIVVHRGRRTGHLYQTAVMVLRRDPGTGEVIECFRASKSRTAPSLPSSLRRRWQPRACGTGARFLVHKRWWSACGAASGTLALVLMLLCFSPGRWPES